MRRAEEGQTSLSRLAGYRSERAATRAGALNEARFSVRASGGSY